MKNNTKTTVFLIALVVIVIGIIFSIKGGDEKVSPNDALAQHITDTGTIFYGAYWCPVCQQQKALFGRSTRLLPYIECSKPNKQGQTQVCIDAEIESYPTWEFPDGERISGSLSIDFLSERTGFTGELINSSPAVTSEVPAPNLDNPENVEEMIIEITTE